MKERIDFRKNLTEILGSNNQLDSRQLASLSDLPRKEIVSFKEAWIKTPEERRRQIISHLVKLQSEDYRLDFTGVFLVCLEDGDEDIRSQAIIGLDREEDSSIITPLIRLVKEDKSEKVRAAAAVALGQFALLAAVKKLSPAQSAEIYSTLLTIIEDITETSEVKRLCLEAIAPLDSPRVRELITRSYNSEDVKVKASALYAMGRNCDIAWLPIIIKEKDNDESEIRYEVVESCGELGMEEAVPTLIELAEDKDINVRKASIIALEQIGGTKSKQALSRLLNSPHDDVRKAAQETLAELEIFTGLFDP
ncbi:MAG: HEAT repeat domain-containing protein [Chloroflexota bacterium]|nr:HEAT repeat domain-containing protein [Chloroflexota bacterium]